MAIKTIDIGNAGIDWTAAMKNMPEATATENGLMSTVNWKYVQLLNLISPYNAVLLNKFNKSWFRLSVLALCTNIVRARTSIFLANFVTVEEITSEKFQKTAAKVFELTGDNTFKFMYKDYGYGIIDLILYLDETNTASSPVLLFMTTTNENYTPKAELIHVDNIGEYTEIPFK